MLTLFTCPKPFKGHIDIIQRNALKSWGRFSPQPQILLMGDDTGVREAAEEFDFDYVPDVARNQYGTPLVSDIFAKAHERAQQEILCYINADIILNSDFLRALASVAERKRKFLMVSQRWNVEIDALLDFDVPHWEETWPLWVKNQGKMDGDSAIDFFAFPRHLYRNVPHFAIGRPTWDNWMIFEARRKRIPVVDSTPCVVLAHQKHDYSHVPLRQGEHWEGPEARANRLILGASERVFTIDNATHRLISGTDGLKFQKTLRDKSLGQLIHELSVTNSSFHFLGQLANVIGRLRKRPQA